jgi:hypothetical protein
MRNNIRLHATLDIQGAYNEMPRFYCILSL